MMRAVGRGLAVLAGVIVLAFVLTRALPGDPVAMLGAVPGVTANELVQLRDAAGLDRAMGVQFLDYVAALSRGDLGRSVTTGRPVAAEILARFPASLELALAGFLPALAGAVVLGAWAARRPGRWVDAGVRALIALGAAVPLFVSGLLLIWVFYWGGGLVPEPSGRLDALLVLPPRWSGLLLLDTLIAGDWAAFRSAVAHLVLPAATMAVFALGPMLRVFRAGLLAAEAGAGVQGARALGLPDGVVFRRYALPEAMGPLVPVALLTFGYLMGANVLVEKVFAWPGIGRYALDALGALDYAPVQGVMLVLAALHVGLSVLADAVGRVLDPRLRLAHG